MYIQENLQTTITAETEVLVAGGGFAGISAALAAARQGAKVTLLEKSWILGGLGTSGLITIYLPLCDGMGNQVSFGIAQELLKLSIRHGWEDKYPKAWLENGTAEEKKNGPRFEVQYNPHMFAILAEQLLKTAGVTILYGTQACAVQTENNKIKAVIIESKSGRQAISVKSVVDCTGDADIFHFAGAPCETFSQGNLLAAWYYFIKENTSHLRMQGACDVPDKDKTEQNAPEQLVTQRYSGLEGKELSEMVQLSHDFIMQDVLKHWKKGEPILPCTIPTIPQIRMTRRPVGIYTMDDTEMHKDFADSVGMFGDWRKRGPWYQLPFRTLYGEAIDNLIAAGRCISVTDAMWDITRVIPVCAVSGEAAGVAAAMTDNFKTINISILQQKLQEKGVKIR